MPTPTPAKGQWTLRITAALVAIIGVPMALSGAELALMGGTWYYFVCGVLMTISAVQLWRAQPSGFFVYAAALLLTLAWAVFEAGNAFWLVGSRIWIIGLIALWLCTPMIRRRLWADETPTLFSLRTVQVCAAASVAVLVAMTFSLFSEPALNVTNANYGPAQSPQDWNAYGGSQAGTRYAPHDLINKDNVSKLERVWEAETGKIGRFSATPIQIEDGLYLCTAQNIMLALDADTGAERWRFDPENDTPPYGILGNCRGVTYYHIPGRDKAEHCAERIYTATTDARMISVDKSTGTPCAEFGGDGEISLLAGMGEVKPLYYFVTSPPTVASGSLVVGGWVMDNQETEEPSGVVRGYDPITGELLWAWDIGREGKTVMPPDGGYYTRGTPNVWSLTSADDELGLVYVPTGNATPDYFGGHRTPVMDKFASSIVAIDARTGLTRWHFQTTHHDIWDYDVPSQPTLVDLQLEGQPEKRKAVIVPTKRGELFVLDRATGELLTEVTEKPVPQSDIPNERSEATQPFSTGMPSFAHPHLGERDMFGISPFDQMACRKKFLDLRYEGPMTPPSTRGTLLYPGPAGGMNWGSVAVDESRQLMVVNNMNLPFVVHMVPREEDLVSSGEGRNRGYGIGGPQRGTPFAAKVQMFSSPLSMPCLKPPYGEIAVVDLTTQKIVWRRGMGPLELGFPYSAGSAVTAGGLIFNGGVMDGKLRAIDIFNGDVVWEDKLRAGSDATPMSYVSPKTGRQYVLVTVPGEARPSAGAGHDTSGEGAAGPTGGTVIAYALPQ
jgi:membrane-bound PQQ-dependent dehydrogenase (glucose/quinate/shikimate family)